MLWEAVVQREAAVIWEQVDEWEVLYFLEDRDVQLEPETTSL